MILMVVLAFVISWTPYFLVSIITQYSSVNYMQHHNYFFTMLSINLFGFLNSSINPIIYVIMSTRFRSGFTRILKFILCASCSSSSDADQRNSSIERAVANAAANANHHHLGSRHHLQSPTQRRHNHPLITEHHRNRGSSDGSSSPENLVVVRTSKQNELSEKTSAVVGETILCPEQPQKHQEQPQQELSSQEIPNKRKRETSLAMIGRYHRRLVLLACGEGSNVSTDSCPTDSGQNEPILHLNEQLEVKDDEVFFDNASPQLRPSSCDSSCSSTCCHGKIIAYKSYVNGVNNNNGKIIGKNILTPETCLGTTTSSTTKDARHLHLNGFHYNKNIHGHHSLNAKENLHRKQSHHRHLNKTSHSQECFCKEEDETNDYPHLVLLSKKTQSDPHLQINSRRNDEGVTREESSESGMGKKRPQKRTRDHHHPEAEGKKDWWMYAQAYIERNKQIRITTSPEKEINKKSRQETSDQQMEETVRYLIKRRNKKEYEASRTPVFALKWPRNKVSLVFLSQSLQQKTWYRMRRKYYCLRQSLSRKFKYTTQDGNLSRVSKRGKSQGNPLTSQQDS